MLLPEKYFVQILKKVFTSKSILDRHYDIQVAHGDCKIFS